jgi:translation initiation factor 4G
LNRCQEDFERGWAAKDAATSAAAAKASEDAAVKKAAEASGEAELYSDEYYAAQKAKRRGLGLIQFIGELYKLQMLTERIMHECIKKLLGNVDNPEEEEIESLCRLLATVGKLLDNPKARAHMDIYFTRMKELGKSNNVASRMQFMLQVGCTVYFQQWLTYPLSFRILSNCGNESGFQGIKLRLQLRSLRFTKRYFSSFSWDGTTP